MLGDFGVGIFDGQSAAFIEDINGDNPDCSLRFKEMFSITAGTADLRPSGSKPIEQYQCGLGTCLFHHQKQIRVWSQGLAELFSGFLGEDDDYRKAIEILVRHEVGHYLGLPHNTATADDGTLSAMYPHLVSPHFNGGMTGIFRECEIEKLVAYRYDTVGKALGEDIEFIRVDSTQNTARCKD